ncbi:uncharacterized protein METZ01_LOCUS175959, partial [marine metagenome]
PIFISSHDSKTLYVAGNKVFKSINEGQSWTEISPDLTRNDMTKIGNIDKTAGVENDDYCTIFSFAESVHEKGVIWTGSDDGLVHITYNEGETWNNITPVDLPEWSRVQTIDLSHHDKSTAYLVATRYKLDEYHPMIFKTTDYGKTWTRIDKSFPNNEITRSIRIDLKDPNILYVGTETGLYITLDDGKEWFRANSNLPVVPVYDIAIKNDSIVLATNGRSFWILDDISAIQQLNGNLSNDFLLNPAFSYRIKPNSIQKFIGLHSKMDMFESIGKKYMVSLGYPAMFETRKNEKGEKVTTMLDSGENPPDGVPIYFYIDKKIDDVSISITDSKGNLVRDYSTLNNSMQIKIGTNRFIWDMNHNGAVPNEVGSPPGPMALAGDYNIELKIKRGETETSLSGLIKLIKDPRTKATDSDLKEQFDLLFSINNKYAELSKHVKVVKINKAEISDWISRAESNKNYDVIKKTGDKIIDALNEIENLIGSAGLGIGALMSLPEIPLASKLTGLIPVVDGTDTKPTEQSFGVFEEINERVDEVLEKLRYFQEVDLIDFQELVEKNNVPRLNIN